MSGGEGACKHLHYGEGATCTVFLKPTEPVLGHDRILAEAVES